MPYARAIYIQYSVRKREKRAITKEKSVSVN